MPDTIVPTLVEQADWMRELVGFQQRQYSTLVETKRLTQEEADRRLMLSLACLRTIGKARAASSAPPIPAAFADLTARGRAPLLVRVMCGNTWHDDIAVNPETLIDDEAIMQAMLQLIRLHVVNVIRTEKGKPR